jgi:hypothetical protein
LAAACLLTKRGCTGTRGARDVEHDVAELAARGVVFEDYDFPALKTVNHIATTVGIGKSAWFKDPDGNTLALFQPE